VKLYGYEYNLFNRGPSINASNHEMNKFVYDGLSLITSKIRRHVMADIEIGENKSINKPVVFKRKTR
jgi:hypothetical protein